MTHRPLDPSLSENSSEVARLQRRLEALQLELEEKDRALQEFSDGLETYRVLLDESSDPIFAFFRNGTYRYVNQAFAEGVGKPRKEIVGHQIWDVFPQDEAEKRFAVVKWVFEHAETRVIEVRVPRSDGDRYYITTVKPVLDPDRQVESVICISKEITERKRMEEDLRRLSTYDILTGLFNRNHFEMELERIIAGPPDPVSVVVADLDNLKVINDRLGHAAGDALIRLTAQVLRDSFRTGDIISRIGGDEFAIILPHTDADLLMEILIGLQTNLDRRTEVNLHVSVGSAAGTAGQAFLDLLRLADDRMYAQKKRHRAHHELM